MKLLTSAKDIKPSDFVKYRPKIEKTIEQKPKKQEVSKKQTLTNDEDDNWDDRDYEYWMRVYGYD